ncbi:MAG: cyclic nucleotide-binding domain-containing protein [Pseudomonadota bacterium]
MSAEVLDKHRQTIGRNALVAGDESLAAEIVEHSKVVRHSTGFVLINHGDETDDVYFVIFGSARIFIKSRFIDTRSAPEIVGEMAALKPGEARSADVVVDSDVFEARVMSASRFREIIKSYPVFHGRLTDLVDKVGRKNLRLLGEETFRPGLSWTSTSAIAGIVAGIAACVGTWAMGLEALYYFLAGPSLAVAVFVGVLLVNPELRYRNLSSAAGFGLIAFVLYGVASFILTIDGREFDLPLIDFSVQTELKTGIFAIGSLSLLLLTYFAGVLDLKLTQARDEKKD